MSSVSPELLLELNYDLELPGEFMENAESRSLFQVALSPVQKNSSWILKLLPQLKFANRFGKPLLVSLTNAF